MIAIVLGLIAAAALPATCPWQSAHYELVGDPAFTIDLVPLPVPHGGLIGDIALKVRAAKTGHVLWYAPDRGSANLVSLIAINDPTVIGWRAPDPDSRRGRPHADGSMTGYASDGGAVSDPLPLAQGSAPVFLSLPLSSETFRHAFEAPDFMPNALFRLSACRAK